jgi:two-component system chemotaxis response regulator CheY
MDEEKTPAPAASLGRVLIIDDSRVARRILQIRLEEKGVTVETAESGPEGIAKAESSPFDVIVVDGLMPGMDGFQVCTELAKLKSEGKPVLVMHTNIYKDFNARSDARASGADEFVLKELDGSPLVKRVMELLSPSASGS